MLMRRRVRPLLLVFVTTALLGEMHIAMAATMNDDSPDGRLLAACMSPRGHDSVDNVKAALQEGANMNVQDDKSGQTPLMAATLRGKTNIVRHLLEEGAEATLAEKSGYIPPHGAGFQGRADIMKLLVEKFGAADTIHHVHKDGFTPFHRACWGREERHTETVRYLLELGVDVNLRGGNQQPRTCWEMTTNEGTRAVLREYKAEEPEL